ncbi:hypothetical protein MKX03_019123 [Papaver bracteatum]|nr:hypothetical protein MKX03_019123 [Papaver bracteatum]
MLSCPSTLRVLQYKLLWPSSSSPLSKYHNPFFIFLSSFSSQPPLPPQTELTQPETSISTICNLVNQSYSSYQSESTSTATTTMPKLLNLQIDPSVLTPEQAITVIASLINNSGPMVALSFFYWAIRILQYRHFMRFYITTASSFIQSGHPDKAHEVLRYIVANFNEIGKLDYAINMVFEIHNLGLPPNVHTLNCILRIIVESSLMKLAENVFVEMSDRGASPNACTYRTMIIGHCREGSSISVVEKWVDEMMEKGFVLDNVACTAMVDLFCKKGSVDKVFGVFEKMCEMGSPPNVINYSALVNQLCKRGSIKQAFEVLEEMGKRGWNPNVYTHTALIDGLCKKGWTEKAYKLFLKLVRSENYKPNVHTYTAMISGYCKEKKLDRAEMLFRRMQEQDLVPNTNTFTTLIDGHAKVGNFVRVNELMEQMVEEGCNPNICTYNSLVNGLCKKGDLQEAYRMLEIAFERGLRADLITYTILISEHCRRSDTKKAMEVFSKMITAGCCPDIHTYTSLIGAFCRQKDVKEGERLLKEALNKGMVPTKQTYTSLICGYCRNGNSGLALEIFQRMSKKVSAADSLTYGALISGLCKESKLKEARILYDSMVDKGISPCEVTPITVAYEYCKLEDSVTAMAVLDRLDTRLWIRTGKTLVRKLCCEGKVEMAAEFYHKLLDKDRNADPVIYAAFKTACYQSNKYSIASGISERISKEGFSVAVVPLSVERPQRESLQFVEAN